MDDVFLFTKAKVKVCQNLRRILQKFCQGLGQIISTHKSRVWFLPNTLRRTKDQVAGNFDIPTMMQMGMYLETPIFTTRQTASAYQYSVDKIKKKIEWQAKYLSMVGYLTLVKSLVASIPIYAMQTTPLPWKVSRQYDKLSCQFLWGNTSQQWNCHTVSWETVTLPKDAGGLGI